tara:strand:+ start:658 stop:885 length:228 start_codon:yes stop_codon:yes gene_type:complete
MTMGFDDGAEISAVVESPNVTINLPEGQPFSFIDSLRNWFEGIVQAFMDGDEAVLFAMMLSIMFIVAGIMIWRQI